MKLARPAGAGLAAATGAVTLPPLDLGAETRCLPAFHPMDTSAPVCSKAFANRGGIAVTSYIGGKPHAVHEAPNASHVAQS